MHTVSVRCDPGLLARLDAAVKALSKLRPGLTRTDLIREYIAAGLLEHEGEQQTPHLAGRGA